MRKTIIFSIIGVVVGLWIVLFVSNGQVLVWEEVYPAYTKYQHKNIVSKKQSDTSGDSVSTKFSFESFDACAKEAKRLGLNMFDCEERYKRRLIVCTYFNGRGLFIEDFSEMDACPNYRPNHQKYNYLLNDILQSGGRVLPMD